MKLLLFLSIISMIFIAGCLAANNAPKTDPCTLQPEPGNGTENFDKFFYDYQKRDCSKFTWTGSGGIVPFNTIQECQLACLNNVQKNV